MVFAHQAGQFFINNLNDLLTRREAGHHLLAQSMEEDGRVEAGEMTLDGDGDVFAVPCGTYAVWQAVP